VLPTFTTTTATSDLLLAPENIYPAIDQAAKDGADIINLSLTDETRLKTAYGKEIIENLETLNIIVVPAAGIRDQLFIATILFHQTSVPKVIQHPC